MEKRNKFVFGGFIFGFILSLLASLHLYTYSNKRIREIRNNDCWNEDGY